MGVEEIKEQVLFYPDDRSDFFMDIRRHKISLNYKIDADIYNKNGDPIKDLYVVLWKAEWNIRRPSALELGQQLINLGVCLQDNAHKDLGLSKELYD